MASGVIYILINPAFKDLLKIGKTTRTAEERAAEISNGTGVPSKFVVAYEDIVADCDLAERRIFRALENYRYENNREFFALKLKEAIPVVMQTVSQVNAEVEGKRRAEEQCRAEAEARARERLRAEAQARVERDKDAEEEAEVSYVSTRGFGWRFYEGVEAEEQFETKEQSRVEEYKDFSKYGVRVTKDRLIVGSDIYNLADIEFAEIITTRPQRPTILKVLLAPFRAFFWLLLLSAIILIPSSIQAPDEESGYALLGTALVLLVSWLMLSRVSSITRPQPVYTLLLRRKTGASLSIPLEAE